MMGVPKRDIQLQSDDGVPIPERGRAAKYALADLEVGQCFLIPVGSPEEAWKIRSRLANAVYLLEKKTAGRRQFTLRTTSDGVRVWRVA